MPSHRVYIVHPQTRFLPDILMWIQETRALVHGDDDWSDWGLHATEYNAQNSFRVKDIVSQVASIPGPVILLEKVQTRPRELLRRKLRYRSIVLPEAIADSTDLYSLVQTARRRYESGEPFLPRKFVVAVLILRKLERGRYWAGKAKGYLYLSDLAKGRGVDVNYADITPQVANDLLLNHILIRKPSGGKTKYALNPDRKTEIYAIIDRLEFENKALERVLFRDKTEVSARELRL